MPRKYASLLPLVLLTAAACSVPIRAEHAEPEEVYVTLRESALTGDDPSVDALLALERAGLLAVWEDDPDRALIELHDAAVLKDTRQRLYGLAELSLVRGQRTGESRWHLGAAVYAYLFLFGDADVPPPSAFDTRFRRACDIYERGLAGAFGDGEEDGRFVPQGGLLELPVGVLDVELPSATVGIGEATFDTFRVASEYTVEGLRARVRRDGLGVPLIAAHREWITDFGPDRPWRVAPNAHAPATAILTVDGDLDDLAFGRASGTLSLRLPAAGPTVQVRGQVVPVAVDVTTPLAYQLTESSVWSFELGAFFSKSEEFGNGLVLLQPYQRGKIPLVLVHGTASSPARWAELMNELAADPVIAQRYQPWLFLYSTGVPITASAASLRNALHAIYADLDPEGTDDALRRTVVAGHSQGGLLTRLMVTSSGDMAYAQFSDQPIDELDLDPEDRAIIENLLFFEPVPQVERVIFVATPHRGSYVAGNLIGKLGSWLITSPQALAEKVHGIASRNLARITGDLRGSMPTAVDNMTPGSQFCIALQQLPFSPRVHLHSIVSVDGDGPLEEGNDGVVEYVSAHLPESESELVVNSPHSCQGHPNTILEVRRILHLHLQEP